MRLTPLRLLVAVAVVIGAAAVGSAVPSSLSPAPASAAGVNQYSPAEWWPLRGANLIGCTTRSPDRVGLSICNGSHHSVNAIDIEGPEGQAVHAAGAGLATVYSNSTACSGYGKTVVVDHGPYGKTLYSHLSGFSPALDASPGGVWVDENTVIGAIGHTGSVSGCSYNHLHLEFSTTGTWGSGAALVPDLKGCVGDTVRTYPDAFGQSDWVGLRGHTSTATSDGTGCESVGRPIGSIDRAAGSLGGFAEVSGWVIDPDAPATSTQVHVYLDGPAGSGATGVVLDADRSRPDVADVRPGAGPLHGYSTAIGGLAPGPHTLWIYAINVGGTPGNHAVLGTPTVTVPTATAGMPLGSIDAATGLADGQVRVAGWALDPDVPTTATQVQVYLDGPAGSGVSSVALDADQARPDIADAFPGAGPGHGFDTTIEGIAPGTHTLWVYAVNASGPAGDPLLGTRSVTVGAESSACATRSPAGPFTDVTGSNVFCSDIEWMLLAGIDEGYTDGTFRPEIANTREMLAVQLYNFAGRPAFTAPVTSPFTDVPTGHPHHSEIAWLASTGLTAGYGDGTFRPTASVSRQTMAAFFHRLAGSPVVAPTAAFIDVPIGHTFDEEIAWLASTGITAGYGDGTFRPDVPVSRQTMAAFLHRYDAR